MRSPDYRITLCSQGFLEVALVPGASLTTSDVLNTAKTRLHSSSYWKVHADSFRASMPCQLSKLDMPILSPAARCFIIFECYVV